MHGATRSRLRIGRRTAGFQLSHICSSGHPTKKATNTALLRFSPRLGSCTVPGRCSRSDPNVFTKPAWRARGRIKAFVRLHSRASLAVLAALQLLEGCAFEGRGAALLFRLRGRGRRRRLCERRLGGERLLPVRLQQRRLLEPTMQRAHEGHALSLRRAPPAAPALAAAALTRKAPSWAR